VAALVVGRCGRVEGRGGWYNVRTIELYVYDAAGHLALSAANGHIDGYRWTTAADGRAMLAGGRALLDAGKVIEAKPRQAVAAK
jgi:hypothetical protein